MDKKNLKNFDQISSRLKDALQEFESIKKSAPQSKSFFDEDMAQKELIKKIKSLINDLS